MPNDWRSRAKPVGSWRDRAKPVTPGGEAAIRGAAQGFLFEHADEAEAAARALADIYNDKTKSIKDFGEVYQGRLPGVRQTYETAQKDAPGPYYGGLTAGGLGSALIPGVGMAKGASTAAQFGKAALYGAASGAGASEAKPAEGYDELVKYFKDALAGAGVGAFSEGATRGLGKVAGKIADKVAESAPARAVKAVTGQAVDNLRRGLNVTKRPSFEKVESNLRQFGNEVLSPDEAGPAVVQFGSNVQSMAPRAAQKKKFYGERIGQIGKNIDEHMPEGAVSGEMIAQKIEDFAERVPNLAKNQGLKDRLLEQAAEFRAKGQISFADAQDFKNSFQYIPQATDALISNQDATNTIRRAISETMEQAGETVSGGQNVTDPKIREYLQGYKQAKGKYRTYKAAEEAATDRAVKDLSNRWVSPSDYLGGAAGLAYGAAQDDPDLGKTLGYAAAFSGLNRFFRTRGSSMAAVTANKLSAIMQKSPELAEKYAPILMKAAERGGDSFVLTHYLLQQKDPAYRQLLD